MATYPDSVFCRSETEYAEKPTRLYWQGQAFHVVEILARWRTPNGRAFRVLTDLQQVFLLSYDENQDLWEIQQT